MYWALNGLPLTITYQDKKQEYEDKGVVFMEESIGEYYNLTIIIPASMEFNNTVLLCSVLGADYTSSTSPEVHLIVFNTLRKFISFMM